MSDSFESVDPALVPQSEPVPDQDAEALEQDSPSEPEETSAEPEKPKAKGVQKRLDELTKLRYDAERDRDYWRQLAMQAQQPQQQQPQAPQAQPDVEPQVQNFSTYEEYTKAMASYTVRQEIRAQQEQVAQQRAQYEAMARREAFEQKIRTFSEQAPDFHSVAMNPSLPINDAMAEAIQSSDIGPALLYHLGKNPQEAQRISQMSPYQAALQLGKLEAQLSAPQPKRVTNAPEPMATLQGTSAASSDPMRLTPEEWARQRNEQLAKARFKPDSWR